MKTAGPSMPVEITGMSDVPSAGEAFYVVADERMARSWLKNASISKNKRLSAAIRKFPGGPVLPYTAG